MQKKKNYYIVVSEDSPFNGIFKTMMYDIQNWDNVEFLDKHYTTHSEKMTYKILLNPRLRKLVGYKYETLLLNCFSLYKSVMSVAKNYEKVIVLFFSASLRSASYTSQLLLKLKKMTPNLRLACFYVDTVEEPVSRCANEIRKDNGVFDRVYSSIESFDWCKEWNTPYSRMSCERVANEYDLYFCGNNKGRIDFMISLANKLRENGLTIHLDIRPEGFNIPEENIDQFFIIDDQHVLDYSEVVERTCKANCILDLVQKGQKGVSLRFYEAVVYNKKLLTNNPTIYEFPYYDARYMKYFDKIEDVDFAWLQNNMEVNFGYKNEFSIKRLLLDMDSM